jgi:hypothetical protein
VYSDIGETALADRIQQLAANQIRIVATEDLSLSSICDEMATLSAQHEQVGLYLHYAEPGTPGIASVAGKTLESIAPYWLANEETRATRGALEGRPIPVTISCP